MFAAAALRADWPTVMFAAAALRADWPTVTFAGGLSAMFAAARADWLAGGRADGRTGRRSCLRPPRYARTGRRGVRSA